MENFSLQEGALRVFLALVCGIVVGYEREVKNHPAGLRTHQLVCVGACLFALLQVKLNIDVTTMGANVPSYGNVVKVDAVRILAQVISSIGFLGAGSIIVTKNTVTGLTTAATLWSVAALGLTIGTGHYEIAGIVFLALFFIMHISLHLFQANVKRRVTIQYYDAAVTKAWLNQYFADRKIVVFTMTLDYQRSATGELLYTDTYGLRLPKDLPYDVFMADLATLATIAEVNFTDYPV
ncbi:MgtC/SapB family protein [Enterococcus nangangensis]|uniref:MgtC/SapB family protein n=1 Tax=Enterococcus nangangensis TaxID=2559926 RepID=UPI0010F58541|nr:MgtC/SapB family protein [Enterococcus nangangensis]